MLSTLLEVTRATHEELERLELHIAKEHLNQNEPATNKDRLIRSHYVRNMIHDLISKTYKLVEMYEDNYNAMKDEITTLGVGGHTAAAGSGTNVFSDFYNTLKGIRKYHKKHLACVDAEVNNEEPVIVIDFTSEEAFGKYLDMHELYNQYINSNFGEPIEYSAYLDVFSQPQKIPRKLKLNRQYEEYLDNLLEYLVALYQRTKPLEFLDRKFSKVEGEFEEQWKNGEVPGWEVEKDIQAQAQQHTVVIDLDCYRTVEELIMDHVGNEKLKEALAALGLKTGGTTQQRAERLFLTKHTPLEKLDKKHFTKGPPSHGAAHQNGISKEIALMEAKIEGTL